MNDNASSNTRSLPLGTSNHLYKSIIPHRRNEDFPAYEFILPRLDLRVVVNIVYSAYVPFTSVLRGILNLCIGVETSPSDFVCSTLLITLANHIHEQHSTLRISRQGSGSVEVAN
jgi:hypothetical protein